MKTLSALLLGLFAVSPLASAEVDARMFRFPDVSESRITFVYAGDIWVVEKQGGTARRLSSPLGEETFPRFSPDGSEIGFSGNYDGNTDIYVVATTGGEPRRITHHPLPDRMLDWTPDGTRLLFASRRESGSQRFSQLYTVDAAGGLPEKLPVPYGEFGALSTDGRSLAFTPKSRGFRNWKRYRGGMAPEIWLFDLESLDARNLTNSDANDAQPMWHGSTLYFLSDRGAGERSNIWALDVASNASDTDSDIRQITQFADFDVTFPAIGPSDLVFQAGGRLYRMPLETETPEEVAVDLVTDLRSVKPRLQNVSERIETVNISPTGKRAVVMARGEVFTLPAKEGVIRNLTHSSGAAERYPAWSPDGKSIAYWSDKSGEYELAMRSADGSGDEEKLTTFGPGYRYRLFWSPDSNKLAFIDHTQSIQIYDRETTQVTKVDEALFMLHPGLARFELAWSRDSRWLTYARGLETGSRAIFLFDTDEGRSHQVTSGYYRDSDPVFDPDGRYLYYFSGRTLRPIYSDLDATWVYPNTTNIVAVSLRRDVPSPLAPRNDEEVIAESESDEKETDEADETDGPEPVAIDLDGFESRATLLPAEEGNYGRLRATSGRVLYHRLPRSGSSSRKRPVVAFDLEKREEMTLLDDAESFELSFDGKKILTKLEEDFRIVDASKPQKPNGPPEAKAPEILATAELEMMLDPRKEWQQIFNDVWRAYRDFFYDPSIHGLDWSALRGQYGELLSDAVTRWDVNVVLGDLIAEVNASHTYVRGGDTETPQEKKVGLLGIDWAVDQGAYRIARIVRGAAWDIEARSPFSAPGVNVEEGTYILAVNGMPLDVSKDPYAAFEGLAGKTVALTVSSQPSMEGAREVVVETLESETRLRHLEWIERNRRQVEEASDGRIGYVYVPNTAVPGQTELVRQFTSQMSKQGLIIDERFNSGGQLPDRFIEKMHRQAVTRIAFRHGAVVTHPSVAHYGPKAMLINGWAGSGGDAFPFFFKQMKVGPLIGERTWGGLIGPAVGHRTIDGGTFTAPPGRIFSPDGVWFAEGHGVDPDIPVVDDPGLMAKGGDPQLEAAIEEVLRLIELDPPGFPGPPPFEKRISGKATSN